MLRRLVIFLLSLFSISAHAEDFELPWSYRSIRAQGMGGAYMAVVRDNDAVFYNPAALRYMDDITIELGHFGAGVNGLDIYNDLTSFPSSPTPADYDQLFGKNIWFSAFGKASITASYFGVGLLQDYTLKFYPRSPGFPTIETYFKADTTAHVGFAVPLNEEATVGFNLKRIQRVGGYTAELDPLTITDPDAISSIQGQFSNAGVGYGIDFAYMHSFKAPFNPTLAFVWQDVGSTAFIKSAGTEAPPRIKDNMSLGVGTLVDLPGFDWIMSLEYRNANNNGIDLGKKLHFGNEFSLPLIDLRAGYSQGYLTYGAGFNLWLFKIDVATYTEELGVYPGQNADNRIIVGLTLDLSFDANFKLSDNQGRKRKLKQRR